MLINIKTYQKLSFIFAAMLMIVSCQKYNERNFPDLEDYKPAKELQLEYTLTAADYGAGNPLFFTSENPAVNRIPELLKTKFPGLSPQSSVMVTYKFLNDVPQNVQNFHNSTVYQLSEDDYKAVYDTNYSGLNGLTVLTPSKALPRFLLNKFPDATAGTSLVLEYDFYTDVIQTVLFKEDFEKNPSGGGNESVVDLEGWVNHGLGTFSQKKWACRTMPGTGNIFAQFGIFSPPSDSTVYSWLITKEIDLTGTTAPEFLFDVQIGFFTQQSLKVKVSSNFDGTTSGIISATWDDISAQCDLPTTSPSDNWSNIWETTTPVNLSAYKGQKIRIALVYQGNNAAELTTRYQIDNLLVRDIPTQTPINAVRTAVAWVYSGTSWAMATNTTTVQPADYAAMGFSTLTTAQAPNFLPALLNLRFPFALNGRVLTVVYKQPTNLAYADQYIKQNGVWNPVAIPVDKTEQYVKIEDGSWIFDPTVVYTMVKDDYQRMVDFVGAQPDKAGFMRMANNGTFFNQELYYGFGTAFANPDVTFQLTVRNASGQTFDPELKNAANDAARVAIMHDRLKDGMRIFCVLSWPNATQFLDNIPNGTQMYYKVRVNLHRPGGDNNSGTAVFEYKFKVVGTGSFEFDSLTIL
jgi:hypothetical protein